MCRITFDDHRTRLCLRTIFYLILFHLIEHKYLKNNRQTKPQNVFIYVVPLTVCVREIGDVHLYLFHIEMNAERTWTQFGEMKFYRMRRREKITSQKRKIVVSIRTLVIHSCCLLLLCNDSRAPDISLWKINCRWRSNMWYYLLSIVSLSFQQRSLVTARKLFNVASRLPTNVNTQTQSRCDTYFPQSNCASKWSTDNGKWRVVHTHKQWASVRVVSVARTNFSLTFSTHWSQFGVCIVSTKKSLSCCSCRVCGFFAWPEWLQFPLDELFFR